MIGVESKGNFNKTLAFLKYLGGDKEFDELNRYGVDGVEALRRATPHDTGFTAESWAYRIVRRNKKWHVEWYNTNVVDGVNIAAILQYGHATRTGSYIEGIDYINPALKPIFEALTNNVWKKVNNA